MTIPVVAVTQAHRLVRIALLGTVVATAVAHHVVGASRRDGRRGPARDRLAGRRLRPPLRRRPPRVPQPPPLDPGPPPAAPHREGRACVRGLPAPRLRRRARPAASASSSTERSRSSAPGDWCATISSSASACLANRSS